MIICLDGYTETCTAPVGNMDCMPNSNKLISDHSGDKITLKTVLPTKTLQFMFCVCVFLRAKVH